MRTATIKPADLARQAFWSLRHPLNQAFCRDHGMPFSLRDLIAYAEEVPTELLEAYANAGYDAVREELEK